jgi:hypothetical protein
MKEFLEWVAESIEKGEFSDDLMEKILEISEMYLRGEFNEVEFVKRLASLFGVGRFRADPFKIEEEIKKCEKEYIENVALRILKMKKTK